MNRRFLLKLLSAVPYLVVFIASLYKPVDADLGWHLKYGQSFFEHGRILRENIFSTQMPDYRWVNSSWATDLITYSVFQTAGFFGLTVLGALMITLTFYFFAKAAHLSFWNQALLFPCLLYLERPFLSISFRGQLLSLAFLGTMFLILQRYANNARSTARPTANKNASLLNFIQNNKQLLLLLPVFFLWVNLHGQFILGLGLLLTWIIFHIGTILWLYRKKKTKLYRQNVTNEVVYIGAIFIGSTLIVLINPFGVGVYEEAVRHFGNPWQKYIVEWMPFEKYSPLWFSHLLMGVLIALGTVFLFIDKKIKSYVPYIGLAILLFVLSLWMRRYSWPMYFVVLFLLKPITSYFQPTSAKKALSIASIVLFATLTFSIKEKWPLQELKATSWEDYCRQWRCSAKAVEYMIANGLTDNVLTLYQWGGWLIWNYPNLKPSIDGRMHLWKDEHGYSAFAHYYPLEQNWQDIDASPYTTVLMTWEKPIAERLVTLIEEGKWQLVYDDDYAGVFVRNTHVTASNH